MNESFLFDEPLLYRQHIEQQARCCYVYWRERYVAAIRREHMLAQQQVKAGRRLRIFSRHRAAELPAMLRHPPPAATPAVSDEEYIC